MIIRKCQAMHVKTHEFITYTENAMDVFRFFRRHVSSDVSMNVDKDLLLDMRVPDRIDGPEHWYIQPGSFIVFDGKYMEIFDRNQFEEHYKEI